MAEELHRLLRMGLSGGDSSGNNGGILYFFSSKTRAFDTETERVQYYKIWEEMQRSGDSFPVHTMSNSHSYFTLPDSTMALCIGLVVGYMIYIIFSLMFQPKLKQKTEEESKARVIIATEHKLHDNVIPDAIRNLYEPAAEFEKVPLLADTSDCESETEAPPVKASVSADVGVHVNSVFKSCGTQIQNL